MKHISVPALAAALLIGGCTASRSAPEAEVSPGTAAPGTAGGESACVAERARSAVGQPATPQTAEQAREAAGARVARFIEPGKMYTMEFNPDRLNLKLDENRIVRGVRCG